MADPDVFRDTEIEMETSIVLAHPDDTLTVFATFVVRDLDPMTEIIVRAERSDGIRKAYRAGADYVSLETVSVRSIVSRIVDEETPSGSIRTSNSSGRRRRRSWGEHSGK